MPRLPRVDSLTIEELLGMGGGYVMDLSNRELADLVRDELGVELEDAAYAARGSSKANRLRCLIEASELATKRVEVEGGAPVATKGKDLVKLWNAQQKAHRAAMFARFSGAFATRSQLIAFLEVELSKGTRSRSAIALDAGISAQTLAKYIAKGRVRVISSTCQAASGFPNAQTDRKRVSPNGSFVREGLPTRRDEQGS